jgi:hypothetical protein
MDVTTSLDILRLQSTYLQELAGKLSAQMEQIAQALRAQGITTYEEAAPFLGDLTNISATASQTAEVLHQRLRTFVEDTNGKNGTPSAT